jgi:type VI secretion system protein ImpF
MPYRAPATFAATPSLVDRVGPGDPSALRGQTAFDWYLSTVERDVETLLNTRRALFMARDVDAEGRPTWSPSDVPDAYPEVQRSVFAYGLPDVTAWGLDTGDGRARLALAIQDAIQRFEPRLRDVSVETTDGKDGSDVRLAVRATLTVNVDHQKVVLYTVLDLASGSYAVKSG